MKHVLLILLFVLTLMNSAFSQEYIITADGDPSDWETNDGTYDNSSLSIHGSDIFNGQWIYKGESNDSRSDGDNPDSNYDITEIRVGASETTLYVLVRFDDITDAGLPIISLALAANDNLGGFNYIGDGAETGTSGGSNLNNNATNVIDIHDPNNDGGADPEFNTGSGFTNKGTAVISVANDCIEYSIAFTDLNGSISSSSTLLLALISGQDNNAFANSGDTFKEIIGSSDAIDGLTPGASSGNFYGRSGGVGASDFDVESASINLTNANLLPVEFLSINAVVKKDESIGIQFSTATETNNAYFDIERLSADKAGSTDSRSWEKLGTIAGAGTTHQEQQYRFVDESPLPGLNYYRVKQVDYDGSFSYSAIVSARWEGKVQVHLFPNPANDLLQISGLPTTDGPITIEIIDMAGRVMLRQTWNESAIDVAQLTDGVYSLRISSTAGVIDHQRLFIH